MLTIRYKPDSRYRTDGSGRVNRDSADISCLSTDEKPVDGIANGSWLYEIDTCTFYCFDEENQRWIPMKGGGG